MLLVQEYLFRVLLGGFVVTASLFWQLGHKRATERPLDAANQRPDEAISQTSTELASNHDGEGSERSPDSAAATARPVTSPTLLGHVDVRDADWFLVGEAKLFVMSAVTFGLYNVFWMDRQWRREQLASGENISPFARAFFGVLWSYSLFGSILASAERADIGLIKHNEGKLAVAFFLLCMCWRLPGPFAFIGVLSVLPLMSVQRIINRMAVSRGQQCDANRRLSWLNWLGVGGGGAVSVLAVVGAILPPPTSSAALSRVAAELNKSLPRTVDSMTAVSVEGSENLLVYHYVLAHITHSEVDPIVFERALKPNILRRVCEDGGGKNLLDKGVTFRYEYRDNAGALVSTINLTKADCIGLPAANAKR